MDPVRYNSMNIFRSVDSEILKRRCVDFTLLGYPQIEPKSAGAQILVPHIDVDEYVGLVAVVHVDASPDGLLADILGTCPTQQPPRVA